MECPACSSQMNMVKIAGTEFDVCEGGCGGIWFDWFEFDKVDEQGEVSGESLLEVAKDQQVRVDPEMLRSCPRCEDIIMSRKVHSVKCRVEIDECQSCGGIFLDAGELAEIRTMSSSDEERSQAAEAYFSEIFQICMGRDSKEKQKEETVAIEKRRKILRFFCPSIWMGLFDD